MRTGLRVVAVLGVAVCAGFVFVIYLEDRSAGEWNYQSNLWMAMSIAAIGALGWFFPRAVGWSTLPITVLWCLAALAWTGLSFAAFVGGGIPLAVSVLFILSGRSKRSLGSEEAIPEEDS